MLRRNCPTQNGFHAFCTLFVLISFVILGLVYFNFSFLLFREKKHEIGGGKDMGEVG